MKLLSYGKDGGPDSCVWGVWLVEIKSLFSVAVLCFENGSREAFHNHAFNSISWVLKGELSEDFLDGKGRPHYPSFKPIITRRSTFHKVTSFGRTWVITFRGPWKKEWKEFLPKTEEFVTLQSGRKIKERKGYKLAKD